MVLKEISSSNVIRLARSVLTLKELIDAIPVSIYADRMELAFKELTNAFRDRTVSC
jgi:hypothetical protein